MTKHHDSTPSTIVQRFKFHTRVRLPGESIATYLAQLRTLARTCGFSTPGMLEEMLRDRLVCGDECIQRRLLAEKDLDYKKAVSLALGIESAAKSAQTLQSSRRPHSPRESQPLFEYETNKDTPVDWRNKCLHASFRDPSMRDWQGPWP